MGRLADFVVRSGSGSAAFRQSGLKKLVLMKYQPLRAIDNDIA
jgi:hypothetical protein